MAASQRPAQRERCFLVLQRFCRGIWPIGRIVKAHVSRDGVARNFDIKTSTGMVQRPAVRLGKVFETYNDSSSSLATECE